MIDFKYFFKINTKTIKWVLNGHFTERSCLKTKQNLIPFKILKNMDLVSENLIQHLVVVSGYD